MRAAVRMKNGQWRMTGDTAFINQMYDKDQSSVMWVDSIEELAGCIRAKRKLARGTDCVQILWGDALLESETPWVRNDATLDEALALARNGEMVSVQRELVSEYMEKFPDCKKWPVFDCVVTPSNRERSIVNLTYDPKGAARLAKRRTKHPPTKSMATRPSAIQLYALTREFETALFKKLGMYFSNSFSSYFTCIDLLGNLCSVWVVVFKRKSYRSRPWFKTFKKEVAKMRRPDRPDVRTAAFYKWWDKAL